MDIIKTKILSFIDYVSETIDSVKHKPLNNLSDSTLYQNPLNNH